MAPEASMKKFTFRPGEPTNPRAWLGVAPLVMARVFPFKTVTWNPISAAFISGRWGYKSFSLDQISEEDLRLGIGVAPSDWRRVLLPMLLEEAKKRGLDV
jgi:hypothetical protein